MDDFLLLFVEILESGEYLRDDDSRLTLAETATLLQIHVEIAAVAVFQHRTECVRVDREHLSRKQGADKEEKGEQTSKKARSLEPACVVEELTSNSCTICGCLSDR